MAIPIKYSIRSIAERKITTALTALGIGLVVAVLLSVLSLAEGLTSVFTQSGSDKNILVLRRNAQSEIQSRINKEQAHLIYNLPGIDHDTDHRPLASAEAVAVMNMEKKGGGTSIVSIRGVSEKGPLLRPNFELIEGRMFKQGISEVIVSRGISERFKNMSLGSNFQVGSHSWRIVGIFDAHGTYPDSEIWADVDLVLSDFKRANYSSVLVRTIDKAAGESFNSILESDPRLTLDGNIESDYYKEQTDIANPIKFLGIFIGIVMAIGASFGAMNTMYASISVRIREIATLRILGFSRISIMLSLIIESLIVACLGGIIGCLMGLIVVNLAFSGVIGTTNFYNFSEVVFAFRLTPDLILWGLLLSLLIGLLGGALPASQASYTKITQALRQSE